MNPDELRDAIIDDALAAGPPPRDVSYTLLRAEVDNDGNPIAPPEPVTDNHDSIHVDDDWWAALHSTGVGWDEGAA